MKFKKQIIIICLFTFLFLPFQVNKSEVETSADLLAIPITIGIKEIITALLVSSGIVITGQGVHHALVNKVYYDNKDLYDSLTEKAQNSFGSTISLKPYINTVTDTISKVYNLTFNDDYIKDIEMPIIKSEFASGLYTPSSTYTYAFTPASTGILTVNKLKYTITQLLVDSNASIYFQNTGSQTQINIWWPDKEYFTPWQTASSSLEPVNWTFNSSCSIPLEVDWETYRDKNKGLDIGSTLGAYSNGSICADNVLDWNSEWNVTQENDYPITKVPSIVLDKDYVNDKPIIKEDETPVTGETLWDTLFGWLKTLFQPLIDLLSWIGDILLSLLDGLKNLLLSLFVPKEGYFVDRFNTWKNDFSSKFFIDLSPLEDLKGLTEQGVKDIHFKIMGVDVVLKLSIINRIAEYSRTIALGVTVITLVWYNYRNAYKLIRGSSPIEGITGHYGGEK